MKCQSLTDRRERVVSPPSPLSERSEAQKGRGFPKTTAESVTGSKVGLRSPNPLCTTHLCPLSCLFPSLRSERTFEYRWGLIQEFSTEHQRLLTDVYCSQVITLGFCSLTLFSHSGLFLHRMETNSSYKYWFNICLFCTAYVL